MNKKTVGLKVIALELDISVNTVSRALRDCDDVSQKTKEKVRQKAIELGYLPNTVSQFINNGVYNIAVVISDFSNLFFNYTCKTLFRQIAKEENYDVCIIYSNHSLDKVTMKKCISQRMDGIISLIPINDEAIDIAKINNMPVVLLGLRHENDYLFNVHTRDEQGGQIMANYLANFHKIDKMLYIGLGDVPISNLRYNSFKDEIEKINKESKRKILCESMNRIQKNFPQLVLEYIRKGYLGIFCFNDAAVFETLNKLNEEIPNFRAVYPNVHICGYDGLSTKITGLVDITSIDFDYEELCKESIDMLKAYFSGLLFDKNKVIDVKLHQRKNKN